MRFPRPLFIFLMLAAFPSFLFLASPAFAEKIVMKDGNVHEGSLLGEDADSFFLSENGQVLQLAKKEVASRIDSEPFLAAQDVSLDRPAQKLNHAAKKDSGSSSHFPSVEQLGQMYSEGMQKRAVEDLAQVGETMKMQGRAVEFQEKMKKINENFKPFVDQNRNNPLFAWAFNIVSEILAKSKLHRLGTELAIYEMEHGAMPDTLEGLPALDPAISQNGEPLAKEYRYHLSRIENAYMLVAEPVNREQKLKTFVFDSRTGRITANIPTIS